MRRHFSTLWVSHHMKLVGQLYMRFLSYSPPIWATVIAGVFMVMTLSLSLFLIFNHLSAYKNPEVPLSILTKFILYYLVGFLTILCYFCACVISGAKVSDWCYSHGAMLCS